MSAVHGSGVVHTTVETVSLFPPKNTLAQSPDYLLFAFFDGKIIDVLRSQLCFLNV